MTLLPLELYRPILRSLSNHELSVVARVSRALQLEAEPLLYQKLDLQWKSDNRSLRDALDKRPERCNWVKALHYMRDLAEKRGRHLDAVYIIQSLTSLTSLWLFSKDARWRPWIWLASNEWRFFLEEFSCYPPDDDVGKFIESQPQIRRMHFGSSIDSWQPRHLSSSTVPHLKYTMLQGYLLPYFVPGRPVTFVSCTTTPTTRLNQILDPLKLSSGPVLSLIIRFYVLEDDPRPLNDICTALPFLTDLSIYFEYQQGFPKDDWHEALSRHQHLCYLKAHWCRSDIAPNHHFFRELKRALPHGKVEWHDRIGRSCSIQFPRP